MSHMTLAQRMADMCFLLFLKGGYVLSANPAQPLASELAAMGDTAQAGMLASAIDLRNALLEFPEGREALRKFCSKPILEHVEGE